MAINLPKKLRKTLVWIGSIIVGLVLIMLLAISGVVWYLTPQRLTPMVESYASEYLRAEVHAGRVELSFWRTFPRLTLEVDSLDVESHSLADLPDSLRRDLPADATQLLRFRAFSGSVNLLRLLTATVEIDNISLDGLRANLLQVNEEYSNFDIVPPSDSTDEEPLSLPTIVLNRFTLTDCGPLSYTSLADSVSCSVTLREVSLGGDDAPAYQVVIDGDAYSPLLKEYNFHTLAIGMDGRITWDSDSPMRVAVDDFTVALDQISSKFGLAVDLTDQTVVERFKMDMGPVRISDLLPHVPAEYADAVEPLRTDMTVELKAELTEPYIVDGPDAVPSLKASLRIPKCEVDYTNMRFDRFSALVEANIDGHRLDASTIELKELKIDGHAIDMDLTAEATNLVSDPMVSGVFSGMIDFGCLPRAALAELPFTLSGQLSGKSDFRFSMSDFTPATFHRIAARGELQLSNFAMAMRDSTLDARTRRAMLRFGTSEEFTRGGHHADSLLALSLKVDTLAARVDSMTVELKNLRAGLGVANRTSSVDSTQVNPFGGGIAVELLRFESPADTLRMRLRDVKCQASLRRYKDNARSPLVNFSLDGKRLSFGQGKTRFSISDSHADFTLHRRDLPAGAKRGEMQRRRKSIGRTHNRADSILFANGHFDGTHPDSLTLAARQSDFIDFGLDSLSRRMLREWDVSGHLTAKRGRIVTPYFPLRNRLSNIDLMFSLDSIRLRDLKYQAGHSDFLVNGSITNLRRALTSRRHSPLSVDLTLRSDTLNVNELIQAAFAGGAIAETTSAEAVWESDESEGEIAADSITGPLLVPLNIDARFDMRAANVVYSDFVLRDFVGEVLVYNGAMNLRNLSARTDIGSMDMSALYSAPDASDMEFGMGLRIRNFYIDKLMDLVPAIDSLMPALADFAGIVNAEVAATTKLTPQMDIDIPSLRAAVKVEGDSLVLLDADTFKKLSKWLFFKNKKRNMIDHLAVEAIIEDSHIELFPFLINIDRYSLGVMGSNDLAMNLNYHVSVLKSPIPFKFGVNIKGTADKMKIRFGGAKYKDKMAVERKSIADTTRINLIRQIDNMFRRSVNTARVAPINVGASRGPAIDALDEDVLTPADSLLMMEQGLLDSIPVPPGIE